MLPVPRALLALLAVFLVIPPAAGAHRRPGRGEDQARPYFDIRASAGPPAAAARPSKATTDARADLARQLGPRAAVEVDRGTGTVRSLQQLGGTLTGPSTADRAGLAWSYVRANAAALGLSGSDLSSFDLTDRQVTDRGLLQLHWTQSYKGIPAFDNDLRVNVDRSGRILNVLGSPLHDLSVPSTTPRLSAADALAALQRNVGATRQDKSAPGARLVIFGGYGAPRLAWHLTYAASSVENYDAIVDADTGQVLFRQNLTKFASTGDVWPNYPGAPAGGTPAITDLTPYLSPAATELTGPNAHAWSDINDNDLEDPGEEVGPSGGSNFNYPFFGFNNDVTTPGACAPAATCSWNGDVDSHEHFTEPTSWQVNRSQNAVQAFWFVNNWHDHLASAPIDFVSPDNFQGDDPVLVNADDGAATGPDGGPDFAHLDNANMTTNPVGTSPKMQMYLFDDDPGFLPQRDVNGGDDAATVYHENTHGLSNRLVTHDDGAGALSSPEAGAMGEAWSDWYAEDYLVRQGLIADDPNTPGDVDLGIYTDAVPNVTRTQPMDCPVGASSSRCPGGNTGHSGGYTYGDFGRIFGGPEVHADGEIWGETLWDLRTALVAYEGDEQAGSDDAEEIVTDGMRLSPPEPTFLEERNAILAAIQADFSGQAATDVTNLTWQTFAHRGMGFYAGATDGSDVTPIEDFSLPPAAGGPTGTIAGTVTSADTGLPVGGIRVGIGGQTDQNGAGLVAATDSSGRYAIAGVPVGTYGKVYVLTDAGFDRAVEQHVPVTAGGTTTRNFTVRRDWASASGGAAIRSTDDSGSIFGCGQAGLIDQNEAVGWSPFNPNSGDPGNPHAGPPTATITLPRAITVRAFLADPGNNCGDDPTAATKGYRIETSPDATNWTVAVQGSFAPQDAGRLNQLAPATAIDNVRYVRLVELSPQSDCNGCAGAHFIDFSELEVLGGPPNALPSGDLSATPAIARPGQTVHFDATSFRDPDSLITGYSWDFDGDGTIDRTTTAAATDFAYPATGVFHARVVANDFVGGGGSSTSAVVVTGSPAPPAPGPRITIARSGRNSRIKVTIACSLACKLTGKATITTALRRKLRLRSRTVAALRVTLTQAGTRSANMTLEPSVRSAMRRRHVRSLKASFRLAAVDAGGSRATAARSAGVKR